ncbi:MAG: DUF4258 domain-containing protein [gamma proteobacterium symbiont of Taylorina sp.]|nr:DUF4258 domain-containing protein [gamma proteobacterium symbiont of Taylorina sp.]
MHEGTLERVREYVRSKQYIMTTHAEEEVSDDELTIYDVEHVIFTGKIIERQKDKIQAEWKYLIQGNTLIGDIATVVAKISITSKLVIITVFIGGSYDM